jgi:hypothetical protein
MYEIRTTGGTPLQAALARDASRWFLDNHMPVATARTTIYVRFAEAGTHEHLGEDSLGSTLWNARSSWNCRSYTIRIDSGIRNLELLAETVLHEMVHVRQMASRTLRYTLRNSEYDVFWKGQSYAGIPYNSQPWEKQAHSLDERLARHYIEDGRLRSVRRRATQ